MPIPPRTLLQMIKREISGIDGAEKIAILNRYYGELPGFFSGEYGKLRQWIKDEIQRAQTQQKTRSGDAFFVAKEGDRQIALLGMPNTGKSSLLKMLTGRQIKVGDYPFTTVKPTPATLKTHGALLQLVEIPGIIEGSSQGLGNGSALFAAARVADHVVWVCDLKLAGADALVLQEETTLAGIRPPQAIIATHADILSAQKSIQEIKALMPKVPVIPCNTHEDSEFTQHAAITQMLWEISDLMRIYPKKPHDKEASPEPLVLPRGALVLDLTEKIHKDLTTAFNYAKVWGPSAKFLGQPVGLDHPLADTDIVEINTK